MGCETQHEREKQEKPRETKGDTEKLSKILFFFGGGGGKQVFSMFFGWCTPTKICAKKGKKKDNL